MNRRLAALTVVLVFVGGVAAGQALSPVTEIEAAQSAIGEALAVNQQIYDLTLARGNPKVAIRGLTVENRGVLEDAASHLATAHSLLTATTTTTVPPTTSTTTAPTTTTTTVPGAIQITPSTTGLIASAPVGATFQIAVGTYPRLSVAPKNGQTFNCAVGAILDGESVTAYAFRPTGDPAASNVTIRGCEIKNYAPLEQAGWNEGAITSKWYGVQGGGSGWLVENVNVHSNRGAGVMLADGGTLRNSQVHHNFAIGVKLYWAPNGGLIEGNSIFANNFDGAPDFNETGGTKFAWTVGLVVRNNHVFDNQGPGLWTDIDNSGTVFDGNLVEGNAGPGIVHEVSFSAAITNNTVTNNGHGAQGSPGDTWLWGAGILIANSTGVTVTGNTLLNNEAGLGVIHQNRVEDYGNGPHAYQTGAAFSNNSVTGPGLTGAVQDIGQPSYFTGKVTFEGNGYSGVTAWIFGGGNLTFAQWRALGHDE